MHYQGIVRCLFCKASWSLNSFAPKLVVPYIYASVGSSLHHAYLVGCAAKDISRLLSSTRLGLSCWGFERWFFFFMSS